ncbi:lipase family alpha/beta hydrolase [Actinoplanes sp. HUAS TT8]|uniref:esterase/lipase family protein n=1 Tax=Actinoplanes sp. HUAS TT8 TaxID=3447453 RepID=UPI003F526E47
MGQPDAVVTGDAVVVVPGIMGSELVDTGTGETLWGLRDPRWYVKAWAGGSALRALALTDDERAGHYGRVRATGLLRFPAFAPVLRGFEPYGRLLDGIRPVTRDPAAVAEFGYDWRLPVSHNAALLADFADAHLRAWRARSPGDDVRVVIVAHSMGGLLARHLTTIPGAADLVRRVITLGTPFYGAAKAVVLLSSGRGGPLPLPHARLRDLVRGLPGVYDLLPTYRCVDTGTDARRLDVSDVRGLGGDGELAEAAFARAGRVARVALPGHVQVVGAHQPTTQSVRLDAGVAVGERWTCKPAAAGGIERVDLAGDGTVYRESAQLHDVAAMPLAQSHGAIARSNEAIIAVADVLTDRRTGPWLGAGDLGLDLPDLVRPGVPFTVEVSGADHPLDVSCRVIDASTDRMVQPVPLRRADGRIAGTVAVPAPGVYRVEAAGGGSSPVSQLVMADAGP